MTTTADIIAHVEARAGHPLNRDEGVHHGDASRVVKGATVAWMATPEAIAKAGEAGNELLIAHESLYYPYDVINANDPPADWEAWQVNRQRRSLLGKYDLTLLRVHGSADEICIFEVFAETLGLPSPVLAKGYVKVFEVPPEPLSAWVQRVKERTGMDCLRIACGGDMNRTVRRIGLPWGGMGLFVNVAYQQRLKEQGCDLFIAGESDNYGFRFAVECGVPMIETSHELSENPGLRVFTDMLADAFPDISLQFHECERIWTTA